MMYLSFKDARGKSLIVVGCLVGALLCVAVAMTSRWLAYGAEIYGEPVVGENNTMEIVLSWATPTYRSTPPQTPLPTVALPPPTVRVRIDDKDTGEELLGWTYKTLAGNPASIVIGADANKVLNPTPSASAQSPRGYERHVLRVEGSDGSNYTTAGDTDFLVKIAFERATFTASPTTPPTAVPTATATRRAGR